MNNTKLAREFVAEATKNFLRAESTGVKYPIVIEFFHEGKCIGMGGCFVKKTFDSVSRAMKRAGIECRMRPNQRAEMSRE